jgi:hypothetical protein
MARRSPIDREPYLRQRALGYTVQEASRRAGVSVNTAKYWRQNAKFRALDDRTHKAGPTKAPDAEPVGIEEFVTSPRYLNKAATVRPAVLDALKAIYAGDFHTVLAGGAIGAGKTYLLQVVFCYELYRLSTRPTPHADFALDPDTPLVCAIQSRTETLSRENDFASIRNMLAGSEYFRTCYPFGKRKTKDRLLFPNGVQVWAESGDYRSILGMNPYLAFLDEVNFMAVTEKSKLAAGGQTFNQAAEMYSAAKSRQMSRFYRGGRLHAKMLIASSARVRGEFTETIEREALTDPGVYVWKLAIWEAKPGDYSPERFNVFIGDAARNPRILKPGDAVAVKDRDLVIGVPVDLRRNFERDIYRALQDDAGIATQSAAVFFTDREQLERAFCRPSIFGAESIVSGAPVMFWPSRAGDLSIPRFVHLDLSKTKDSTGLALAHVAEWKALERGGAQEIRPRIIVDGVLQIRPPQYSEISYGRIRELLYKLRANGLNIVAVSADTFQSVDMLQELSRHGFRVSPISVDRTAEPYANFKDGIADGLIELPRHAVLQREALTVQIDYAKGKVDHPANGAKDCLDAVVGVCWYLTKDKALAAANDVLGKMLPTPPLTSRFTMPGRESAIDDAFAGWSSRDSGLGGFSGAADEWVRH